MGDCMFGPPPGPALGNAGRVSWTILPSLAVASATLEVMVLPPLSKKLKYGDELPVHCSVKAEAAKIRPVCREIAITRLTSAVPTIPSPAVAARKRLRQDGAKFLER